MIPYAPCEGPSNPKCTYSYPGRFQDAMAGVAMLWPVIRCCMLHAKALATPSTLSLIPWPVLECYGQFHDAVASYMMPHAPWKKPGNPRHLPIYPSDPKGDDKIRGMHFNLR
uniref:Uncharacterized protein n=1 Tax=Nelumbo nucifera TaxID=4432 RepID=A0A822YXA7_NELNU|nr:TPA_asm: hypothetical protein HUJ06_007781 [Nelumbo nucifera]